MTAAGRTAGQARPTAVYYATSAFGLTAIPFAAIALGALLAMRRGGDPTDALDTFGLPAMVLAYGLAFADRLVFWSRTPAGLPAAIRAATVLAMLLSLGLTAVVLAMLLSSGAAHDTRRGLELGWAFGIAAVLCQVAAVTWLVRYRKQGFEATSP